MKISFRTPGVIGALAALAALAAPVAAGAGTAFAITPDRPVAPDLPLARSLGRSFGGPRARPARARPFVAGRYASARAAPRGGPGRTVAPAAPPVWTVAADSGPRSYAAPADAAVYADDSSAGGAPSGGLRALIGGERVTPTEQASVVAVGVTDGPSLGGGAFILLVTRSRSGGGAGSGGGFVTLPGGAWAGQDPLTCMTQAVYFEARGEPLEGQEGVAQVVMNRTRLARYPGEVCGVVFQGAERSTGCQFSFTCDGAMNRPLQTDAWRRAQEVAQRALDGFVYEPLRDATHFHAGWVNPYWSSSLTRVKQIGGHIFYR